uniref:Plexin A2 n=2 Tax=Eptatretus burgeri TaxID=7764 RepID=A0A8C4WXB4_EPTBU
MQVSRVPVERCDQYSTCERCLGAGDPHCGWCVLHSKCCRRESCPQALRPRRFAYGAKQCVGLMVIPGNLSVTMANVQLTVRAQSVPDLSAGVNCSFDGFAKQLGHVAGNVIGCHSPSMQDVPQLFANPSDDTRAVALQLTSAETGLTFASVDLIFYNCSKHPSCLSCVRSPYPCHWCMYRHQCTDNPNGCFFFEGRINTSNECPQLLPSAPILLPVGVLRRISLSTRNLPQPQSGQHGYECVVWISGRMERVPALRINSSSLQCQENAYAYEEDVGDLAVNFSVVWNGDFSIDNPANIKVHLYKCEAWRDSCGKCLKAEQQFHCGWCRTTDACTLRQHCPASKHHWLHRHPGARCTGPRIKQVTPAKGPREGGTLVTIRGENLGLEFADVEGRVFVAGVACSAQSEGYVPAEQIVCKMARAKPWHASQGSVRVCITECTPSFTVISKKTYSFVKPTVFHLIPTRGPVSGGSMLTLYGQDLDSGSSVTVTLGNRTCDFYGRDAERVMCRSPVSSIGVRPAEVRVQVDAAMLHKELHFEYAEDPTILHIHPDWTILEGGTLLTVSGQNLDISQEPKMRVKYNGVETEEPCHIRNASTLVCLAPGLTGAVGDATLQEALRPHELGFRIDGVRSLLTYNASEFNYYPNPSLDLLGPETLEIKPGTPIFLKGQNLNPGPSGVRLNYSVLLGEEVCTVTSSENQLLCECPNLNGLHELTVRVGAWEKTLGKVHVASDNMLSLPAIAGVAGGAGLLLFIVVAVLVAYKRKSKQSDLTLKRLQMQMDNLESRVALECKEAFAELQTDINELTSDVDGTGIPFLDYRTYAMRVLFPGIDNHPVLKLLEVPGNRQEVVEKGLRQFGRLLNSKVFLLNFIRTLEAQRSFSMRDRGNVASLIMTALQGKMEFATDVLKHLLSDLIMKNIESRNHPKLLLRRYEITANFYLWYNDIID